MIEVIIMIIMVITSMKTLNVLIEGVIQQATKKLLGERKNIE